MDSSVAFVALKCCHLYHCAVQMGASHCGCPHNEHESFKVATTAGLNGAGLTHDKKEEQSSLLQGDALN